MTVRLHPSPETRRRLAGVARGEVEADLVLTGGALVDVFTEDVREGCGLAVVDGRVAFAGPDAEVTARAGGRTERVELGGDLVAPGLVESHTHPTPPWAGEMAAPHVPAGGPTPAARAMGPGAGPRPDG